jgi:hypothetical protein
LRCARPVAFVFETSFLLPHSLEQPSVAGFTSRTVDEARSGRSTFFELDVTSNMEQVDFEGVSSRRHPPQH